MKDCISNCLCLICHRPLLDEEIVEMACIECQRFMADIKERVFERKGV